ncbi:hypothetical protein [Streptomyces sp. NBC_01373]|uniref:hypothetical protein n=1 Tax=Streptomyces sp. NBC_01373 TaxID=2903843 RepID=UPI002252D9EE|nr:hypothetical protein [Streptomyces sp. NBC_01373]MCX4697033.1 hypothetical protein [Streptomyces sp. NBC_01373]MCX4707042.1 hypothetical protein [Streptomyces sp. NBC_01373]
MTTDPTPDPTAYIEVLARLLCAADVHVHEGDHPSWQELRVAEHGRGQDDYRKAARWLAARLTVTPAVPAGLVAVPPTTADRDRIELAIHSELTEYRLGRDTGMIVQRLTDAMLGVLPPSADRAALERVRAVLETEAVVGRTALEYRGLITSALMAGDAPATPVLPAGSEDTTTTQAATLRDAADFYDQLLTDMGTDVSCDPRYWTAVRDIVMGLRRRAAETQPETQARPAAHEWFVETRMLDGRWSKYGAPRDTAADGRELFERDTTGSGKAHAFRLVHATTTYTVEAEHQPDTEAQDAPRREPHPTEADLRHALAVAAKFHGQDTDAPAAVQTDEDA